MKQPMDARETRLLALHIFQHGISFVLGGGFQDRVPQGYIAVTDILRPGSWTRAIAAARLLRAGRREDARALLESPRSETRPIPAGSIPAPRAVGA